MVSLASNRRLAATGIALTEHVEVQFYTFNLLPAEHSCVRSLRVSEPHKSVRSPRSRTTVQASAVEVFQLADEGALIGGTAAVLFACTLVVRDMRLSFH